MTATLPANGRTTSLTAERGARVHLSLNVADLDRSIGFFRAFFGCEPAKCRVDYAKFELADPPLVLSLEPYPAAPGGNLNHLGFRVATSVALVDLQRRLELAGMSTLREEGVECCYARQTKFWVHDPDGNMWEVYTLDEDLEHRGDGQLPVVQPTDDAEPAASIWKHQLGQPFPASLPILSGTVDRAVLQGTFNQLLTKEKSAQRLEELHRILKPGGSVQLHMLTADRPTGDAPVRLPGPAAAVQAVPVDEELLEAFRSAGFAAASYAYRATSACFRLGDAELRETRIVATK